MSGDEWITGNAPPGKEGNQLTKPDSAARGDEPRARKSDQIALEKVIRPVAIAGMMTCIALSLAQFMVSLFPEWPGGVFVGLVFFVSLESIHSQRIVARMPVFSRNKARFRFAEGVVVLLVVRFAVYLEYGPARLMADLESWTSDIGKIFDASFLLNSVLLLIFWALAQQLSLTLQELEAQPIEKTVSVTDPRHYLRSTMPRRGRVDRQSRLHSITSLFLGGGLVLVLFAALSQAGFFAGAGSEQPRSTGVLTNMLAYFLIGLLFISQAQYTILKANWELDNVSVSGQMGRRWGLWVLLFLLLIGLVSALLPVGYSVGLLDALAMAIEWIVFVVSGIAFAIGMGISWVLTWLESLVTGQEMGSAPRAPQMTLPAPPPTVANEPNPWWSVVRSFAFWVILSGLIGYSLFHFVNDRWGLFQGPLATRFLAWLRGLWRGFRKGTQDVTARIRREIARRRRVPRVPQGEKRRWRFLSLRRLSPRDRVRYFYLSILRRSAQQEEGRAASETPLEYEKRLARAVPEVGDQVRELTWGFIEARYSEHDVTVDEASALQRAWRYIKRSLILRKRGPSSRGTTSSPAETEHSS